MSTMNTKKDAKNINLVQSLIDNSASSKSVVTEIYSILLDYTNVTENATKKIMYDGIYSRVFALYKYIDAICTIIQQIASNANASYAVNSIHHDEIKRECDEFAKKLFFDYGKCCSTAFNSDSQFHLGKAKFNTIQKECADFAMKRFNMNEHDLETMDGNFHDYINMNMDDECHDIKNDANDDDNKNTKHKKTKAKTRSSKKPRIKVAAVKRIDEVIQDEHENNSSK